MANTVHGPYAPTTWANGSTPIDQANLNNLETQGGVALHSFNPDLITAAYVSDVACVKDSATASQLNITSGAAYLIMSDGTLARIDVGATTQSTTGNLSTTLYLDLNPDGSWSFATTHSASANYLPICQVTTDGSGNIATVTDKRVTLAQLLSGAALPSVTQPGGAQLPAPLSVLTTQSASNAGIVTGSVTFGQMGALRGSFDGAASFNGSTDYISIPTAGLPTGNSAWTLEGWFKTSTTGAYQFIVGLGGSTSKTAALLYITNTNVLTGDLFSSNIVSTATVTDGAWHHAAFTWDGTNATLYLDGAQVATSATLGPDNIAYGMATIGAQDVSGSYTNFMNGALDEVAIYDSALSSTRVSAHYTAGVSTTSDGYASAVLADAPLRYYRLGDASGATSAASTISATQQTVVNADGTLQLVGINGQASTGSFGVPVIVAQTINTHITSTGNHTVISYTPAATGLYRISGWFLVHGGTLPQGINFIAYATDPITGTVDAPANYFSSATNVTSSTLIWNNQSVTTTGSYMTSPLVVYAGSGGPIAVTFGGTNDCYVSVVIERLA